MPGKYVQIDMDWATYTGDEPAVTTMVASHELGHNLGLDHSNGLGCFDGLGNQVELGSACLDYEYLDEYTTMGMAGASDHALLDADRLESLGWLAAGESQDVTGVGTYSLVPVYSSSPGVRLLRIARPTPVLGGGLSGAWTLELRSTLAGAAWDQFAAPTYSPVTTGVTVRYSEGFGQSGISGQDFARNVQRLARIRQAHRVAVHGGVVERRHLRRRDDLGGRDAAQGFEQGQPLLTHRPHLGEHQVDGFVQADHRCASSSFGVTDPADPREFTDLTDRPRRGRRPRPGAAAARPRVAQGRTSRRPRRARRRADRPSDRGWATGSAR